MRYFIGNSILAWFISGITLQIYYDRYLIKSLSIGGIFFATIVIIIGSAIIWGAVIIGCSLKLKGTAYYEEISPVLIGGMITHLILIWGPLAGQFMKKKEE